MVSIEQVNGKNVWDILRLNVADEQKSFVAGNDISIIEAYTATVAGGHAFPFGIFDDGVAIGFFMIGYSTDEYWENPPKIAKSNYCLWRLMIGRQYQQKGYGKLAMQLALDFVRSMPCGQAEYFWLSYEPENTTAKKLYHSFGFRETGDLDGEEVIAALKL